MTNVYMELGSVFGHTAITHPEICSHLMGQILKAFGGDHVIWGTDSIWWGSPQWQIEAFRRFEIPEAMQEKHGYPALTRQDKELILGLNSARMYGIDVPAALEGDTGRPAQPDARRLPGKRPCAQQHAVRLGARRGRWRKIPKCPGAHQYDPGKEGRPALREGETPSLPGRIGRFVRKTQ